LKTVLVVVNEFFSVYVANKLDTTVTNFSKILERELSNAISL
jgi:hypothetical protein